MISRSSKYHTITVSSTHDEANKTLLQLIVPKLFPNKATCIWGHPEDISSPKSEVYRLHRVWKFQLEISSRKARSLSSQISIRPPCLEWTSKLRLWPGELPLIQLDTHVTAVHKSSPRDHLPSAFDSRQVFLILNISLVVLLWRLKFQIPEAACRVGDDITISCWWLFATRLHLNSQLRWISAESENALDKVRCTTGAPYSV